MGDAVAAAAAPVRILIADDHELVRRGLVSIISRGHPEWQVVGEASNGLAAIELAAGLQPNVAVLDLSMPGKNGIETAERLKKDVPGILILVLTMHAAGPILRQLKRAGVNAYLVKSDAPRLLIEALERMLRGDGFFASDAASSNGEHMESTGNIPAQFLLTTRELDVMRELARGKSNKQVAADLDMSVRTAETHRANILAKLGAHSIGDLIRIAIHDGMVERAEP